MIQITPHMRILVAVEPVDFRAGIDGLAAACRKHLLADPFSGGVFVFGNRARTGIKILVYDGQGFWLCHKRLPAVASHGGPTGLSRARAASLRAASAGHGRGPVALAHRAGLAAIVGGMKAPPELTGRG